MDFLEKYLPINTPEKVNILVSDIIRSYPLPFPRHELINQISLYIRKKKLQEKFRVDITPFINTKVDTRFIPHQKAGVRKKSSNNITKLNSTSKRERKDAISSAKRYQAMITNKSNNDNSFNNYSINLTTSLTIKEARRQRHQKWKYQDNTVKFVSPHNIIGKNLKEIAIELHLSLLVLQNIFTSKNLSLTKSYSMKDFNLVKDEINSVVSPSVNQKLAGNPYTCSSILRQNQRFSSSKGKEGNYFKLIYIRAK